jgi:hypothetical protein
MPCSYKQVVQDLPNRQFGSVMAWPDGNLSLNNGTYTVGLRHKLLV